jgi:urease accessory protein
VLADSENRLWRASLSLGFSRRGATTVLSERRHTGPLTVQKPFYPEQDVCHVYLLHPPGGFVPGDRLLIDIHVQPGAHALITTPAAGKCYRSDGRLSKLDQTLRIESDAALEWFPQETILYKGCYSELGTVVQLAQDARFIGWEIVCLGRPASDELFDSGSCRLCLELWRDKQPLLLERGLFVGGSEVLNAAWGVRQASVLGTFVATDVAAEWLPTAREISARFENENAACSVTQVDGVLVCRYLGHHAAQAKDFFTEVWRLIRPSLLGREACLPRIWST